MRHWLALCAALAWPGVAVAGSSLTLVDPAGEKIVLAAPADGEALLVHFWATWCPTCPEDMRHLEEQAVACGTGVVRVLTVNVGESPEEIADFVAETGLGLPVFRDPSGRAWRGTGALGLPSNLYWTAAGQEIEVGPKDGPGWRARLAQLGCRGASPDTLEDPRESPPSP